ncbi:MAG: FG-GAP-like repeat-containing protein [bacterium]|nr:FG-GAP-like repeat-containing protein [bacterium]
MKKVIFAGIIFSFSLLLSFGGSFSEINSGDLDTVNYSSIVFGDLDGDNDLDLILTGVSSQLVSRIYINDGMGAFSEINTGSLTAVYESAAVLGDLDNDGDLDLILSGFTGSSGITKIYANDGSAAFSEINPGSLTALRMSSLVLGDIDNDGDLDVITCGYNGSSAITQIFQNNGSGSFSEINPDSLPDYYQTPLALGDIDNDGDLDLFIGGSPYTRVFQNDGTGSFTEIFANTLGGSMRGSIALADLNSDGYIDLIASGFSPTGYETRNYINNYPNGFNLFSNLDNLIDGSIALGDLDNDGDSDLIVTGMLDDNITRISKIYSNNSLTFSEIEAGSLTGVNNSSIALGDIDGDNDLDLILTGNSSGGSISKIYQNSEATSNTAPNAPGTLSITAVGGFWRLSWAAPSDDHNSSAQLRYHVAVSTSSSGDYNYIEEIICYPRGQANLGNVVNNISRIYQTKIPVTYSIWWKVCAIDSSFKKSNFSTEYVNQVPVLSWTGEANYVSDGINPETGDETTNFIYRVKYTDADNNAPLAGYPKVHILKGGIEVSGSPFTMTAVNAGDTVYTDGKLYTYTKTFSNGGTDYTYYFEAYDSRNAKAGGTPASSQDSPDVNIDGFFEINAGTLTGISFGAVVLGDIDNDNDLDLILSGWDGSDEISKVYKNDGTGSFSEVFPDSIVDAESTYLTLGDIDNDGDLDLIFIGNLDRSIPQAASKIYQNDGTGHFTEINPGTLENVYLGSTALGDIDNDGDLDLILSGITGFMNGERTKIYQNDGTGFFTEINAGTLTNLYESSIVLGDIDSDGDLDMVISGRIGSVYVTRIYQNDGTGLFTDINTGTVDGARRGNSVIGDIDGDGDLDLIITGWFGSGYTCVIYTNDGHGIFTNAGTILGVMVSSLALGDIDNDGDLDLILTGNATSVGPTARFYKNDGTGTFTYVEPGTLQGVMGSSIALGDIDGDNDLDLILTGENATYYAKIYRSERSVSNLKPSVPDNLTASNNGGFWKLSWNVPSDDHTGTNLMRYKVIISTCASGIYNYINDSIDLPRGQPNIGNVNNSPEHYYETNIPVTSSLYWSVCAIDTSFISSGFASEVFACKTGDITIPGQVVDLSVKGIGSNYVTVQWMAPGDDGYLPCFSAYAYDVRYSTGPINSGNWDSITQATGEPAPGNPGNTDVFSINNLENDTTYYFGLKTRDYTGNWSDISNIVSCHTGFLHGIESATVSYDNNDGYHYTNWVVNVKVKNESSQTATGISSEIVDCTDWVIISDGTATYNDISSGGEGWSTDVEPFKFDLTNRPPDVIYIKAWFNIMYTLAGGKEKKIQKILLEIKIPDKAGSEIPRNLTAVITDSGIKISWDKIENAEGYNLYRYNSGIWEKLNNKIIIKNNFLDTNVIENILYSYKVTCIIDNHESGFSAVVKAIYLKNYSDLSEVKPFPNPANDKVIFDKIPKGSKIYIYTLSGELIYETISKTNSETWFLVNKSGKYIGNGIYFFTIEFNGEIKKGKLAIVR